MFKGEIFNCNLDQINPLSAVLTIANTEANNWVTSLGITTTFVGGTTSVNQLTSTGNIWLESGGGNKIFINGGTT
jgi:hypothetical protein